MYGQGVPDAIPFICKGLKTMCSCFGLWHYSSTGVSEMIWGDFNIEHVLDVDWCHLVDLYTSMARILALWISNILTPHLDSSSSYDDSSKHILNMCFCICSKASISL